MRAKAEGISPPSPRDRLGQRPGLPGVPDPPREI